MEDLMLNANEHKMLKRFKKRLEKRYGVEIRMPKATSLDSDIIFVSIHGEKYNRDSVKQFLSNKMNVLSKNNSEESVTLITISDSEEELPSIQPQDESIIEISTENSAKFGNTLSFNKSHNDSVCVIEPSIHLENTPNIMKYIGKQKKRNKRKLRNSPQNKKVTKKMKLCKSMHVIEEPAARIEPALEFIPLCEGSKSISKESERTNKSSCQKSVKPNELNNDEIIIIDEPVSTVTPRCLRPIVIDGSNVAREHGKVSGSFSVKGIQLAIDYFLNRGHTQVTAFVPRYRRSPNPNRRNPTTDAEILDDLEKKQLVVYTPSRYVNQKRISSYDDRFVVQLAATNGGIIVSNDNYRDLLNEDESFTEAIEQRLLMFCFAGDVFMVPNDPLGQNGPTLKDFLSFPPDSQKS